MGIFLSLIHIYPYFGVVSSNCDRFPTCQALRHPENNLEIKKWLMKANVIQHTGMMVRKSVLEKSGVRYEFEFFPAEDYMICVRLIQHTMFYNIQEVLVKHRFDENSETNTTTKQWQRMVNADAMIKCIAYQSYPALIEQAEIPIHKKTVFRLFGFIPLFSIKRKF